MKHICIFLIKFYRKYLSPLKGAPCCRFTPTCSAYALEAFRVHGFFIGLALSVWRILRCNPFCKGGYDPVPQSKRSKRKLAASKEEDTKDLNFLSDKAHGRK